MTQPTSTNRDEQILDAVAPGSAGPLTHHQVGNWRLLDCCGSGTFGAVYRAQHVTSRGLRAAVKILHDEWSSHEELRTRFIDEATAAARTCHENIVQIFDVGVSARGNCYMVMELLEGRTLRQVMAEAGGRMEPARAIHIGVQVARALAAAHARGIVHRDLKPDNIIVIPRHDNPEFVKVIDFGIARMRGAVAAHAATRPGRILGTVEYMAPELWRALPDLDGRVDVYALGVILYWALAGRPPFAAANPEQWMVSHLTKPVLDPMACGVPADLAAVLIGMLEKERDQRIPNMLEVAAALQGARKPTRLKPNQPTQVGWLAPLVRDHLPSSVPAVVVPIATGESSTEQWFRTPPVEEPRRPGRHYRWALACAIALMAPLAAFAALHSMAATKPPVERTIAAAQTAKPRPPMPVITPLPAPIAAAAMPVVTRKSERPRRSVRQSQPLPSQRPMDRGAAAIAAAAISAGQLEEATIDYSHRLYQRAQSTSLRIAESGSGDTDRAWRLAAAASCQLRDVEHVRQAWQQLDRASRVIVTDVCRRAGLSH